MDVKALINNRDDDEGNAGGGIRGEKAN